MYDDIKLLRDLELAANVQRGMVPADLPSVPGYSFWAYWEPALRIGGDLYDFRQLPTGEILTIVADVAGKGMGAAMMMAFLSGMLPFAAEQCGGDLARFVGTINKRLHPLATRTDRFATLVAVALDP